MFMGEYNHTVDAKGRLIVPSRFREQLGEDFVVTRGLDGCLSIYARDEWNALEEKLHALPYTNPAARKLTRFLVAGAATCEVDKQGRILLPAALREYAKISRDGVRVLVYADEPSALSQPAAHFAGVPASAQSPVHINPALSDVQAVDGLPEQHRFMFKHL